MNDLAIGARKRSLGATADRLLEMLDTPKRPAELDEALGVSRQRVEQILRSMQVRGLVQCVEPSAPDAEGKARRWIRSDLVDCRCPVAPRTQAGRLLACLSPGVVYHVASVSAALGLSAGVVTGILGSLRKKGQVLVARCNPPWRMIFMLSSEGVAAADLLIKSERPASPADPAEVLADPAMRLLKAFAALDAARGDEACRLARLLHPEFPPPAERIDPLANARRVLARSRYIEVTTESPSGFRRRALWRLSETGAEANSVLLALSPLPSRSTIVQMLARSRAAEDTPLSQMKMLVDLNRLGGAVPEEKVLAAVSGMSKLVAEADLHAMRIRGWVLQEGATGRWRAAPCAPKPIDWEEASPRERRMRILQEISRAPATSSALACALDVDHAALLKVLFILSNEQMVKVRDWVGGEAEWMLYEPDEADVAEAA